MQLAVVVADVAVAVAEHIKEDVDVEKHIKEDVVVDEHIKEDFSILKINHCIKKLEEMDKTLWMLLIN